MSYQDPAAGGRQPTEAELRAAMEEQMRRIRVQDVLDDLDGDLPIAAPSPSFADEGPHLAYAIQWFSFALIGLVGYFFLIRRAARRSH